MPYFHDLALKQCIDLSGVPTRDIYLGLDSIISTIGGLSKDSLRAPHLSPALGAYVHYGCVELMDRIDMLPEGAVSGADIEYIKTVWQGSGGYFARAVIAYTFHIVVRELRHGSEAKIAKAKIKGYFGTPVADLLSSVTQSSSYIKKVEGDAAASVSIGAFLRAVEKQYRDGGWGGSFGGEAWADITKVLVDLVHGKMSPMMAADRIWTLQHNTCSIFNKPIYFMSHCSVLKKVLDAQANGSVFSRGIPKQQGAVNDTARQNFEYFIKAAEKILKTHVKPVKHAAHDPKGGGTYKHVKPLTMGPISFKKLERVS